MLEVIVEGKDARKKRNLHQATIAKQIVYNILIFGGYFGLVKAENVVHIYLMENRKYSENILIA